MPLDDSHPSDSEYTEPAPSLAGEVLDGRFVLEALLGEGSFGAVYRALDLESNQAVAVKVLHDGLSANDVVVARFEREARAAAMLRHPNGVEVIAFGASDERPWMAMELLEGRNLEQVLSEGPVQRLARVVDITSQLCDALTAAHARGIVHRDIKPANVVLCGEGESHVKLCDFGIARLRAVTTEGGRPLTAAGEVIGSPAYIAPEQARGDKVDHRCDIYALGILLYEMTTGKLPYAGGTAMNMLLQHITEEPTPPSAHDPAYPGDLERIVLRCLSKDPDLRYQTASYLQSELAALLTDPAVRTWTSSGLIPVQRQQAPRSGYDTDRPKLEQATGAARDTQSRSVQDAEPATGDAPALEAFYINRTDPNLRRPAQLAQRVAADRVDAARRRQLLLAAALGLGVLLVIVLLALSGCDATLPGPGDPQHEVPTNLADNTIAAPDTADTLPIDEDTLDADTAELDVPAEDTASDADAGPDDTSDDLDTADTVDTVDTADTLDTADTEPVDMGPTVYASCAAARDDSQPTGPTLIQSGAQPLQVWCEQTREGGGWALIATISNADAHRWVPGAMPDPWTTPVVELGTADPTVNADYRSPAFDTLPARELRITIDDTFLLRTNTCLDGQALSTILAARTWACDNPDTVNGDYADCSLTCDIAEQNPAAETEDVLLGGSTASQLFLRAGETDSIDSTHTDRTWISTDHREYPHYVGGLGARCVDLTGGGNGCSGQVDISRDTDSPTAADSAHHYSLWIR